MIKTVVAVVACAIAAPAHAQSFEKFVANLSASPEAAAKHLADCELLIAPNGDVRRPCKLAFADLAKPGTTLAVKAVKRSHFPHSMLFYVEADVEVRDGKRLIATYHVVEIGGGPGAGGDEHVEVQHWNRRIGDADALALAKAGKLLAAPAVPEVTVTPKDLHDQALGDRDSGLESLGQWLTGDLKSNLADALEQEAIVIGTAPNERLVGKSGAKTLRAWKTDLRIWGLRISGGRHNVVWAVTQIKSTTKDKAEISIIYDAFVVWVQRMTPGGGALANSPAIVQFSIPQSP
jgi:hypothetical protein